MFVQVAGPGKPFIADITDVRSVTGIHCLDIDFDDTRFRSFQSQDHVQVLKTETDWPRWSGDGANRIIIVTKLKFASVV